MNKCYTSDNNKRLFLPFLIFFSAFKIFLLFVLLPNSSLFHSRKYFSTHLKLRKVATNDFFLDFDLTTMNFFEFILNILFGCTKKVVEDLFDVRFLTVCRLSPKFQLFPSFFLKDFVVGFFC